MYHLVRVIWPQVKLEEVNRLLIIVDVVILIEINL